MKREFQVVATGAPMTHSWGSSTDEAVLQYMRTFALRPGDNILARPLDAPGQAELFHVGPRGLRRLKPGGVR
jgi:hypothetical protein